MSVQEEKKILVVDDNSILRGMISRWLEGDNLMVIQAENALEGWAEIEKNDDIGLIITNILMPGPDGFRFIERITTILKEKQIPVVIWTNLFFKGGIQDKIAQLTDDYGLNIYYVPKPITVIKETFLKIVREVFDGELSEESKKIIEEAISLQKTAIFSTFHKSTKTRVFDPFAVSNIFVGQIIDLLNKIVTSTEKIPEEIQISADKLLREIQGHLPSN